MLNNVRVTGVLNIMVKCNLCSMEFSSSDELLDIRKKVHEVWHLCPKIQKRNTTEGKVIWDD
jgi:hypothetical protein